MIVGAPNHADQHPSGPAEALRDSEERYRSLVELAQDAILILENDCICYSNHAGVTLFGATSAEDLLGRPIDPFIHPDDRPRAAARRRAMRETGKPLPPQRFRVVGLDQRHRDVDAYAAPCIYQGRPAIQAIVRDQSERARTEAALRQSEEHLRAIIDAEPECLKLVAADGALLEMNPAGVALIEAASVDELLGQPAFDRVAVEHRDRVQAAHARVLAGHKESLEFEMLGLRGTRRWMESHAVPLYRGEARDVVALYVSRDVTERKQAEESARVSRRMVEFVLNNIPQGVFWKDCRSVYLGCNLVVARAMGFARPEDIVGKTDFDFRFLSRAEAEFYVRVDEEVMRANEPRYGIIETMTRADGSTIWLETNKVPMRDDQGRVVGILGTWQDITDRKRGEEALRGSETRLRLLLEQMPAILWSADAQLRVTSSTGKGLAALGLKPGETVGATIEEVLQTNDPASPPLAAVRRALAGQTVELEADYKGRALNTHIEALRDPAGQVAGVIGLCLDVTERKQAEEERRKLEAQVLHAQKLESLGVLAGGVAHDFNNLLTAMLGYASLAQKELPAESRAGFMLKEIEKAAHRAAELAQQMLAYSGKGKFVLRAIRLAPLVQEMAKLLETVISRKAALHLELGPATIEGDPTQVRQVVMNLITNASDALENQPGAIAVRTGVQSLDAAALRTPYSTEDLPAGDYACIEVQDSGCGMSEETLRRIFDPFFTTKFAGRGLGLAAVLGIVRGHRGAIQVSSAPGQGTTFRVLLPTVSAAPAEAPARGPTRGGWRGEGLILVVEDEEAISTFVRQVLEAVGFEVCVAQDGQAGLDLFRQSPQAFRALVLDLTMPHMDGTEVLRQMRCLAPEVPVLLMSGYSEQEAERQVAGLGVNVFLQKPFRPNDLLDSLRLLLPS